MAIKPALTVLNATSAQIINTIRANASYEYQSQVPEVTDEKSLIRVGDKIMGAPAFRNQFVNALINRIALVIVKSMTFNNKFANLKKGYLEFGETIEDVFVKIAKVVTYDPNKAISRELKRTLPEVESAFYKMNWQVMYPITVGENELRQAFMSFQGVENLITKIVDAVYTAAEYDEYLLFKYLIIKAIARGKMYAIGVNTTTDMKNSAKAFRGTSNLLQFPSTNYNEAGVLNTTPRERQIIFMDSQFNADFDVDVLASAFNMNKADFMGRLELVDSFATFDNTRWAQLREAGNNIEEVTAAELKLTKNVKAVLIDSDWFQIYDNLTEFTEQYLGSTMEWNYWLHTWKTIASSPFANAICFVEGTAPDLPTSITLKVDTLSQSKDFTTVTLTVADDSVSNSVAPNMVIFNQTEAATKASIAVERYGAIVMPVAEASAEFAIEATVNGTKYTGKITPSKAAIGNEIILTKGESVI